MAEITRIMTLRITSIIPEGKPAPECLKEEAMRFFAKELKDALDVDDVVVEEIQEFELDK